MGVRLLKGGRANLSWILIALLVIAFGFLIRQNFAFRATIRELRAEQRIRIGSPIAPLVGTDLTGQPASLELSAKKKSTIILFASTTCKYCRRQNPLWAQFLDTLDRTRFDVVLAFRNSEDKANVRDYLSRYQLYPARVASSDRVVFFDSEDLEDQKFTSTPITLVAGPQGVVTRVVYGLWDAATVSKINAIYDTKVDLGAIDSGDGDVSDHGA